MCVSFLVHPFIAPPDNGQSFPPERNDITLQCA